MVHVIHCDELEPQTSDNQTNRSCLSACSQVRKFASLPDAKQTPGPKPGPDIRKSFLVAFCRKIGPRPRGLLGALVECGPRLTILLSTRQIGRVVLNHFCVASGLDILAKRVNEEPEVWILTRRELFVLVTSHLTNKQLAEWLAVLCIV